MAPREALRQYQLAVEYRRAVIDRKCDPDDVEECDEAVARAFAELMNANFAVVNTDVYRK